MADARRSVSGNGFYYLVAARNACGVGSWGRDSTGLERLAPDGPCD
jgi:hypothetical protein